jgi:hypothetical protein
MAQLIAARPKMPSGHPGLRLVYCKAFPGNKLNLLKKWKTAPDFGLNAVLELRSYLFFACRGESADCIVGESGSWTRLSARGPSPLTGLISKPPHGPAESSFWHFVSFTAVSKSSY